jgi:hypothetical protein
VKEEFRNNTLERPAAGKLRWAFTLEEYNIIFDWLKAVHEGLEKPNFNDIKMLKK